MSAPPSPRIGQTIKHDVLHKKRDRTAVLAIPAEDREAVSDGEVRYTREYLPSEQTRTEPVSLVPVSLTDLIHPFAAPPC